jgi:hypothetical protein
LSRSVGLKCASLKKSRVWSKAMITMTNPRRISMDANRPEVAVLFNLIFPIFEITAAEGKIKRR